MTDRERYKRAFASLHTSREIQLEVTMKKTWNLKKTAILCACILTLFSVGISASAYGGAIWGWGNNVELTENGENGYDVYLHTDDLTDPVRIENDRMFFIVNEEYTDITDLISEEDGYVYRYTDLLGDEHVWIIGLNSDDLENYGYAEFIYHNGQMIGGYAARVNTQPDGSTKPWLDRNKPF